MAAATFVFPALQAVVFFGAFALLLTTAGVTFGMVLSEIPAGSAGLIARRGLRRAFMVARRGRRIARTNPSSRAGGTWRSTAGKVGSAVIGLVLSCCLAGAAVVLMGFRFEVIADGRPLFSDTERLAHEGIVMFALLAAVVALRARIGLVHAVKLTGAPHSLHVRWPLSIPDVRAGVTRDDRFAAAVNVYHLGLQQFLLKSALVATVFLTAQPMVLPPRSNQFPGLGYAVALGVVMVLGWVIDQQFRRRLRALSLAAAYVQPPARQRRAAQTRAALVRIVAETERYAHRLQRKQGLDVRHPVAHLLHLTTAQIRGHLSTFASVSGHVPDELDVTLRRMTLLLAGASGREFLESCEVRTRHLVDQVQAAPQRRSWSSWLSTTVELTDKTVRTLMLLAGVTVVLILLGADGVTGKDLLEWVLPQ